MKMTPGQEALLPSERSLRVLLPPNCRASMMGLGFMAGRAATVAARTEVMAKTFMMMVAEVGEKSERCERREGAREAKDVDLKVLDEAG